MCLSTSKRSTTSAGVPGRPQVRLCGCRLARASEIAATISLSPSTPAFAGAGSDRRASSTLRADPWQILDLLGNQPVTKGARRPPCLDHRFFLARRGASRRGAIRPQQRVVERADVLERFLELVVIAAPPAHVINLFAAQAELARGVAPVF